MKVRDILSVREFSELPLISNIIFTVYGGHCERLDEGDWVSGRFDRNIKDRSTDTWNRAAAHGRLRSMRVRIKA
jgi:hypothetical protein